MGYEQLSYHQFNVNPIQDRGGEAQKGPVTSTNVGISPQNFLTFGFDPFVTLV